MQYRAEPYRPAAAYLYTADDPQAARAIAANLFQAATLSDTAAVANATALLRAGLAEVCTGHHSLILFCQFCLSQHMHSSTRGCTRPCCLLPASSAIMTV